MTHNEFAANWERYSRAVPGQRWRSLVADDGAPYLVGAQLLVMSDDKISRAFIRDNQLPQDICPIVDRSGISLLRTLRLVRKGVVTPKQIAHMALAEMRRPSAPSFSSFTVQSSDDVLSLVDQNRPTRIILFRAGLIVKHSLLETGIPIRNIHAARIPEYGGLGSIARALQDRAFDQCATLHVVTPRVDDGEILDIEPYRLDESKSYAENEALAYAAATRLLGRLIRSGNADNSTVRAGICAIVKQGAKLG